MDERMLLLQQVAMILRGEKVHSLPPRYLFNAFLESGGSVTLVKTTKVLVLPSCG